MEENPSPTPPEAGPPADAAPAAPEDTSGPPFPVPEETDLNDLFPEAGQDLNDLFPEKELRTLLRKVHKSKKDLHKITTRFVDDSEHVVPHLPDEEDTPDELQ